ncbi:hypothetical protein UlMin_029044 [Ulmus minor]
MANYGAGISLSPPPVLSPNSSDSDSDNTAGAVAVTGGGEATSSKRKAESSGAGGGTASPVECQRKPRGRPPGSKNKPKPPIIITKDNEFAFKPEVLEISPGSDVIESITQFARRRNVAVSVLSAAGSIANLTVRHHLAPTPSITLHGPLNLVSITGTYLGWSGGPGSSISSPSSGASSLLGPDCVFGISVAGPQGQVLGGVIAGKIIAASLVVVVVGTFVKPLFHRVSDNKHNQHHNSELEERKPSLHGGNGSESSSGTPMSISSYNVVSIATPLNCQVPPEAMPWGLSARSSPYN